MRLCKRLLSCKLGPQSYLGAPLNAPSLSSQHVWAHTPQPPSDLPPLLAPLFLKENRGWVISAGRKGDRAGAELTGVCRTLRAKEKGFSILGQRRLGAQSG